MKSKIKILLIALLVIPCLTRCSDFLKESSQDEVRPSTVSDMEQLFLGSAYLKQAESIFNLTEIFTDDVQCNGLNEEARRSEFEASQWKFSWSDKMFIEEGGGYDPLFWEAPYRGIKGCNVALDYLDKVWGDDKHRESLRGEALVLRSYYYFMLVNFFGLPYNYGIPEENLGVPLKLEMGVTAELFTRDNVAKVYRQIEKDLIEGNRLLETYDLNHNIFRIGHVAAKAILSRVYLYMENWEKALHYADEVLKIKPDLLDLNLLYWYIPSMIGPVLDVKRIYNLENPDEIIWARSHKLFFSQPGWRELVKRPYSSSEELCQLLGSSAVSASNGTMRDLRGSLSFCRGVFRDGMISAYYEYATVKSEMSDPIQGIRTAEIYLNRAEAYIRKYLNEGNEEYRVKALADLNKLRSYRFNNAYVYEPVVITDADELLQFYKEERRRELCGEGNHRWFDIRRYGMTGIKHTLFEKETDTPTVYELEVNRLVLPIPEEVIRINPKLKQNP